MLNTMTEHRARRARGDRGFTLIELLVVVVIIGVLIAIATPLYLNYRKGANDKAAQSDLRNAISVMEVCNTDNSTYPTAVDSAGVMTGCAGQTITRSANTTFEYSAATPTASYKIVSTNSGGTTGRYYCYNSATGGPVRTLASTTLTLALGLCT